MIPVANHDGDFADFVIVLHEQMRRTIHAGAGDVFDQIFPCLRFKNGTQVVGANPQLPCDILDIEPCFGVFTHDILR